MNWTTFMSLKRELSTHTIKLHYFHFIFIYFSSFLLYECLVYVSVFFFTKMHTQKETAPNQSQIHVDLCMYIKKHITIVHKHWKMISYEGKWGAAGTVNIASSQKCNEAHQANLHPSCTRLYPTIFTFFALKKKRN